jgi:hypothetical protein
LLPFEGLPAGRMGAKKQAFPSEGRQSFFVTHKTLQTFPLGGMFLVALCMCTHRHKSIAKINCERVLSKFNDIFLKKRGYFILKYANNIVEV